ncbi:Receptor-type tyrosine-protein phosphatase R [Microtus ochrogaster]|uniref:Receptor-type tyrosine-protein phosphatase R n=1 Tax=Microtus ochrogaster TaxID=79684 RepID=A0A8J6KSW9_MICOH|nr:Receptor-type tyrosine-protein phosphatase R [Microtus ochrogaster]
MLSAATRRAAASCTGSRGCSSGNNDHFLAIRQKKSWKPVFIYRHSQDIEKSLDIAQEAYKHSYHSPSEVQIIKRCSSGNNDHFLAIRQKKSWKPVFIYRHSQDIEKSLDIAQEAYKHSYHSPSEVQIIKRHQIVNSAFPRPAYDPSLNLLATSGQDLEIENLAIPAADVIVMVSTKLASVALMLILVLIMMLRLVLTLELLFLSVADIERKNSL